MKSKLVFSMLLVAFLSFSALADDAGTSSSSTEASASKLSKEDQAILDHGPISNGQYYLSGAVGSLVGFGTGQLLQGRDGSLFAFGESASLGILIFSSTGCTADAFTGTTCGLNIGSILGIVAFLGFKVWDAVDVWRGGSAQMKRYKELTEKPAETSASLIVLPMAQNSAGLTVGMQVRF